MRGIVQRGISLVYTITDSIYICYIYNWLHFYFLLLFQGTIQQLVVAFDSESASTYCDTRMPGCHSPILYVKGLVPTLITNLPDPLVSLTMAFIFYFSIFHCHNKVVRLAIYYILLLLLGQILECMMVVVQCPTCSTQNKSSLHSNRINYLRHFYC